jgi:Lipocalin-like domain
MAKYSSPRRPSSSDESAHRKILLRFLARREIVYGVKAHPLPNLAGTWRLLSYQARASAGEIRYPLGQHVVGQLLYDVSGNMSALVMKVDRPTFASDDSGSGSDAEVRAAFEGNVSNFGTYTIDPADSIVTHHAHGASYPNWIWVTTRSDTAASTVLALCYRRRRSRIGESRSSSC